jgi:cell division septation protein DedD
MPRNEEGEFELVVGNRQLLTIVFILMLLFGIVFSMGYFVGRNSVSETASTSGPARPAAAESAGLTPPGSPPAPSGAAREAPPPDSTLEPGQAKVAPTPIKPEAEQPKPPEAPKTTPPTAAKPKESAPPTPPPTPEPAAAEESPTAQPAPGQTFLQVAAVRRPEAELMVDVLKRRGFPARIAPVPDKPEFRVLVGPLKDSATLARTQADLQTAGFRSIVRKY